jgi:hypothetical protein
LAPEMAKPVAVHLLWACICHGWLKLGLQQGRGEAGAGSEDGDVRSAETCSERSLHHNC